MSCCVIVYMDKIKLIVENNLFLFNNCVENKIIAIVSSSYMIQDNKLIVFLSLKTLNIPYNICTLFI